MGLVTMGASMEAIRRETSMVDIMGVLQTAEDQIVDQHSMENLVIQARLVGSTVAIMLVIQMVLPLGQVDQQIVGVKDVPMALAQMDWVHPTVMVMEVHLNARSQAGKAAKDAVKFG